MADKDFKVKSGLDLGTPLPLTEGGTGQTSASNALNALLPVQTDNTSKVLQTNGTSTSWVTLPNGFTKGNTASRPGSPSLGDIYSNTQTGYIEVYTNEGWSQLGVIPESATIGTATDVGTNRPYNNGAISVSFTPSATGGLVSRFTATSTSGGYSAFSSSSPITVPDIPVGTSATFTVTATNGYGNALPTTASNSATTTTVPQAPTIGTASNPSGSAYGSTAPASLTFTAGATGGKTISNYKYSVDNSTYTALSPEDTTSPVTIPGLTSGQSYTIRLKAVNDNGDSIASSASNSVTVSTVPQAPTIGTATDLNNSTGASITFTPGQSGNSTVTGYTVTSSPSGFTATGSSSPLIVSGLTGGQSYTFTVTATNANGTSLASSASNSVTITPSYAEFASSGTWTPSSYPATYRVYALGGGGALGNYGLSTTANSESFGGGGGGGGGYFTTSNLVTINSGSVAVVIGNGGVAAGAAGGTTSVGSFNASGGSGGGGGGAGNGGSGAAGGSGGGGGCGYHLNYTNGFTKRVTGGVGGTNGGSGAGGDAGGGSGSGVAQSPSGGSGGDGGLSTENPGYGGFTVSGLTFAGGRGKGGGYVYGQGREAVAGYAVIQRNS